MDIEVPGPPRDGLAGRDDDVGEGVGELGGGDRSSGHRRHRAEVAARENAQLVQAAQRPEVEESGAESAPGETQADALALVLREGPVPPGLRVALGPGHPGAALGRVPSPAVSAIWA